MNHIQKSFLASADSKLIPFQLIKTNYGFSSADGDDVSRELAGVNANQLGFRLISLPQSSTFVAVALRIPMPEDIDQSLRVFSIGTSPIGETELTLQLQPGDQYHIYVLSDKYKNGYINQIRPVPGLVLETTEPDELNLATQRAVFSLASPTDRIELELLLELSSNESDWYPYAGKYERDFLLWADPTPLFTVTEGIRPQGNYSYLAYQLTFLDSLLNTFIDAVDLTGPAGRTAFNQQFVGALRQVDDLTPDALSLRQSLAAQYALTRSVLVFETWENDTRLINTDEGVATVDAVSNVLNAQYRDGIHAVIGNTPSRSFETDQTVQYNMAEAPEQILAGYTVLLNYVIAPYDNDAESTFFHQDFRRGEQRVSTTTSIMNRKYSALARVVREAVYGQNAETNFASDRLPVMFEEGNAVVTVLRDIVGLSQTNNEAAAGARLVEYVDEQTIRYAAITSRAPSVFASMYIDPFGTFSSTAALPRIRETIGVRTRRLVLDYVLTRLEETNTYIRNLGDFTFIPPPEGEDDGVPPLAHEATLQNIRFLRNLLEEMRSDLWTQNTNFGTFIVQTMINLRDEAIADLRRSNTVVNITHATQVANNEVDVLYMNLDDQTWRPFRGQILELGNGVKAIDVSFIRQPGHYVFMVRPQSIDIVVKSIPAPGVIQTPSLDNFQSKNYFYGWNIEFAQAGSNGLPLGEQRMIVGSAFSPGASSLVVSPNITARPDFTVDINARIWPNTFVPILVDVDITEHNFETLAYANYARREFNTDSGVLTLYDFSGNVYKQWTVGERTLEQDDFANIEFRDPIE